MLDKKYSFDKVEEKDKRHSTNEFLHNSMHLDKNKEHKKSSKRQTLPA